jgi:hypothetical protein
MDRLEDFLAAVRRRLDKGRVAYGDRTFELPASSAIVEAQAELLVNAASSSSRGCGSSSCVRTSSRRSGR